MSRESSDDEYCSVHSGGSDDRGSVPSPGLELAPIQYVDPPFRDISEYRVTYPSDSDDDDSVQRGAGVDDTGSEGGSDVEAGAAAAALGSAMGPPVRPPRRGFRWDRGQSWGDSVRMRVRECSRGFGVGVGVGAVLGAGLTWASVSGGGSTPCSGPPSETGASTASSSTSSLLSRAALDDLDTEASRRGLLLVPQDVLMDAAVSNAIHRARQRWGRGSDEEQEEGGRDYDPSDSARGPLDRW